MIYPVKQCLFRHVKTLMKSPTLRTILDALQGPPGVSFATDDPTPSPALSIPNGPSLGTRLSQSWTSWRRRHSESWLMAKILVIFFWVMIPAIIGFVAGIIDSSQAQAYQPFAHHYQWFFPFFTLSHYLGTGAWYLGCWMAK